MSDGKREEHDEPRKGESEHEWMQRETSPELRWLDLFERLTVRIETSALRAAAFEEESRRRAEVFEEESRQREERIQRKIESIVEQQAQFTADLQQSREEQAAKWKEQQERWEKADARWAGTEKGIRTLLAIAEIHEREIEALKDSQERTGKQLSETAERVDALVDTVERLITRRRNSGGSERRED